MNELKDRLKELRNEKDLSQEKLAKLLFLSQSAIAYYELGKKFPNHNTLNRLANFFSVSTDYLLGRTDNRNGSNPAKVAESWGIYSVGPTVKIPIIGVIRAGEPIFADQNIIGYEDVPATEVKDGEYFYLMVTGDSMIGSRIHSGDKVLIRKQSHIENNEIAVVLINNEEATLKRVKYIDEAVILYSDNPKYQPLLYKTEEVKIIGKAVEVKFKP